MNKKLIIKFKALLKIIIVLSLLTFTVNITFGLILPKIDLPMYVGSNVDWLNFIAIFLGSGLTLYGVHWQLKANKEEHYDKLVSNTTATYGLLEMESKILKLNVFHFIEQLETLKNEILKNPTHEKNEVKSVKDTILEWKDSSLLTEKNVIFSFINESLPKEKIILIDSTSKLMIFSKDFSDLKKFNKNINDFESLKPLYETLLTNIENYIEKLESRKIKFKKDYPSQL